ncbi:MAG: type I-B CRISPR-associated protein Cas7/Cst2/DevR [Bacteroidota bacterium]
MKNLKTQGFILIDVDVAALNNAGKSTTTNLDNGVATKKIRKNGQSYVYVSGQAWRYWWRDTLQKTLDWKLSPVTREKKIAFTAADPIEYPDDDVFGYMKAAKGEVFDKDGNVVTDKKGNPKLENVTVTRISPLKNSALVAVTATQVAENWSSMSRQNGDAVPYTKEEYSTVLKGMFSIDLEQVGTFSDYNKTGYKNLTSALRQKAIESGAETIEDQFVKKANGEAQQLIRMNTSTRKNRIIDTIEALKFISGGAMQTNNMADVTPKFIILSTMTTGNHPFSHIAVNSGQFAQNFLFNINGLKEVLKDYKEQFEGRIYIGTRSGFLDTEDMAALQKLAEENNAVKLLSVNEAIDQYCDALETQISS